MPKTHDHEVKSLFLRVLQHFSGDPKGVSEPAITYQFQTRHNRSPHTIKKWLDEQTGLFHRRNGRIIVEQGATFITKDKSRNQPKYAPPTIRKVRRNKGTNAGHAFKNEDRR